MIFSERRVVNLIQLTEQEFMNLRCAYDEDEFAEMPADSDTDRSGGLLQTPVQEHELEPPAMPLRTD